MHKFITHTGEIVAGEKLQAALDAVATWYEQNAHAIRKQDLYASHVTESRKEENLNRQLELAASIRAGKQNLSSFWLWQRIDTHLTGECIAFLPKTA